MINDKLKIYIELCFTKDKLLDIWWGYMIGHLDPCGHDIHKWGHVVVYKYLRKKIISVINQRNEN